MKIFAILQEPANYTLDIVKHVYDARGVKYGFVKNTSLASSVKANSSIGLFDIWHILRENDVVVVNGYTGLFWFVAICLNILFFRKPMPIDSDTELQIPTGLVKRTVKWIWLHFLFTRKYLYGFAGGNYGHKDLFRHYGMPEKRIFMVPMMVDNAKYERELPDSPHRPFRFGYLGRLIALKQVDKIIRALPEDCELHVVGDGEERLKLESMTKDKGVVFHGKAFGNQKIKLLHSFDCLILYSFYEPWGLVVNEALASGIPVIVSDKVGAKKDLVEGDRPTGLVVPWNDAGKLAAAMQEMSTQEGQWMAFSRNAVSRMKKWDYGLYGAQFDSFVKELACCEA